MSDEQPRVTTGGGAYFAGTVTAGGDVIGGDKIVHGNEGLAGSELAQVFQTVYRQIEAPAQPRKAESDELKETVERIERETAKGDAADAQKVGRWLGTLADVAPDVLETAVNALTNPGAAVASAVRIVAQQFRARAP